MKIMLMHGSIGINIRVVIAFICLISNYNFIYLLNNINLYLVYCLIMLSFYPFRKVFVCDWLTLKESFKVISHPDDYDSATVASNYTLFAYTNIELRRKVELFKLIKS